MSENKNAINQDWVDPDEAPDLSHPDWAAKMSKASVKRGRPLSLNPKVSTTIRLDADLLAHLKTSGKGWQTRANDALREALGL